MTENTIVLDEDDVDEVAVPEVEDKDHYRINVQQGKVRFGDTKSDTFRGSIGVPGDRGQIKPEPGDTLWVRNVGIGKAKVELVPRGLEIEWYANQQVNVTSKVFPGVEADEINKASSGAYNFKSQTIPEGASLLIEADPGNDNPVYIGAEDSSGYTLPAGGTVDLAVSNMASVPVYLPNGGETVKAIVEVDN